MTNNEYIYSSAALCNVVYSGDHSVVHFGENWGTARCHREASPVVRKCGGDLCSR